MKKKKENEIFFFFISPFFFFSISFEIKKEKKIFKNLD